MMNISNSFNYILVVGLSFILLLTGTLNDFSQEFAFGNYTMLALLWISVGLSVVYGRIPGLIFSMLIILIYAAIVFYQGLIGVDAIIPLSYVWIISYPASALISGFLGEEFRASHKKLLACTDVKENLITKDELTGFGNAKEFYQNLKIEMSLARRHNRIITIALIEIQYFDELMAIYGRSSYSRIFDLVSAVLAKCTRTEDTIYRISEKTFSVIMPYTPADGADIVKGRIKDELAAINTFTDKKFEEMHIEVRVGVASLEDDVRSELEFKKRAEKEVEYDV